MLDTAERLFAERGPDAVSVRDITNAAGVNLAAINYHFGSKQALIAAVFERRMRPLTEARLRALDGVEAVAGDQPPKLEAVLDALFRPAVEQALDPARGGGTFAKLMARCLIEPNAVVEQTIRSDFETVVKRFDAALMRAMPGLTADDVFWRRHWLIGALHHSLLMLGRKPPGGRRLPLDIESYAERFVAFAAAGFRAVLPGESRKRSQAK